MVKVLNKFINIVLIFMIVLLVLNSLYVIQFSTDIRNVFLFLTLITMLFISVKDLTTSKSGISKFLSVVVLICTIIGGVMSILSKQFNYLIYICVFFSILSSVKDLIYSKA